MRKLILLLLILLSGCAKMTEEKRAKLARETYAQGMSAYTRKDYREAISKLREALKYLENLTPEEIKSAKYTLGESYYLRKDYINAIVYLEDFLFYYPDSPEAERVYFMVVDSYMRVAPDAYRDQSYTLKAIDKAKEFLSKYPNSPYGDRVLESIEGAQTKLAKHEYLIGRFYEDFGYHYSASLRYKNLLVNYPGQISEVEVLYRYIKSLLLVREQAKKQEAKFNRWINSAKEELKKIRKEEDRSAVQKRIEFFQGEIERWRSLAEESYKTALKHMETYKEVYGENPYYRELLRYAKQ
ncbi:MAG: outer membrane protein assembly factor BamD [Aquificaceae bacterium]|nr:outer membrane protein assembly factor BamD [Aquificaceae bacterium]MCS7196208.1 outer membrane protein assembly factor BamD [Aquificaceae bacterium]MCX7990349.1 outer membrane protein assembly factor BamD [Aquificaceae bacterium]MDW8032350.1 outer membrane protein assembly factor BamD [Aquificaceae bacterium]MDW8293813.1 outer membrane protein assembly factor BamD [Aquificaceae bacterium]